MPGPGRIPPSCQCAVQFMAMAVRTTQATMTKINGTIFPGYGRAGQCIEKQKPFLNKYVPEIMSMFSGTLNFHLLQPILIRKYDLETPPITWDAGQPPEIFYFLRAKIEFPYNPFIPGHRSCLIYNATRSAYRNDSFTLELITEEILRSLSFWE